METLGKFNSKEIEERILAWGKDEKIYEAIKAQEPQEEDKKFFYLDGPPYTTGDVHLGTAWNKILKDYVMKYKSFILTFPFKKPYKKRYQEKHLQIPVLLIIRFMNDFQIHFQATKISFYRKRHYKLDVREEKL